MFSSTWNSAAPCLWTPHANFRQKGGELPLPYWMRTIRSGSGLRLWPPLFAWNLQGSQSLGVGLRLLNNQNFWGGPIHTLMRQVDFSVHTQHSPLLVSTPWHMVQNKCKFTHFTSTLWVWFGVAGIELTMMTTMTGWLNCTGRSAWNPAIYWEINKYA